MDFGGNGDNSLPMGKEQRKNTGGFPHVKAHLEAKRGSQSRLAKRLGITEGYLSAVLSGSRGVSMAFEERLARELKTTRDGLRRPIGSNPLQDFVARLEPEKHPRALRILQGAFDE